MTSEDEKTRILIEVLVAERDSLRDHLRREREDHRPGKPTTYDEWCRQQAYDAETQRMLWRN